MEDQSNYSFFISYWSDPEAWTFWAMFILLKGLEFDPPSGLGVVALGKLLTCASLYPGV
jgi:hypothetical protein